MWNVWGRRLERQQVIKCNSIRTFSVSYVDVNCLECYHHTILAKRFLHELPWATNKFLKPPLLDSKTILLQAESTFLLALRVELTTFWFATSGKYRWKTSIKNWWFLHCWGVQIRPATISQYIKIEQFNTRVNISLITSKNSKANLWHHLRLWMQTIKFISTG